MALFLQPDGLAAAAPPALGGNATIARVDYNGKDGGCGRAGQRSARGKLEPLS